MATTPDHPVDPFDPAGDDIPGHDSTPGDADAQSDAPAGAEAPTGENAENAEGGYTAGRPVHFEIHAADPERAVEFYSSVFGWTSQDWSAFAGMPYFGMTTGEGPGIDGAIMKRQADDPEVGGMVAGAILTMGVADYDETAMRILDAGGSEALPKYALPGMAWQGYFHDTANNVFGIHQPDPEAK